ELIDRESRLGATLRPDRSTSFLVWAPDVVHHALPRAHHGRAEPVLRRLRFARNLARGYRDGYVYQGQNSQFRRRPHGAPVADIPAERFVVYSQTVLQPRSCLVLYRVEESGVA